LSLTCFWTNSSFGWFENGHHLIAVMAYELLNPEQKAELRAALKSHPRYADDFNPPASLVDQKEIDHWLIGRAAYWPDIARGSSFDRPTWHYELGATLKIGNPADVPDRPGAVPQDATLESQNLYLSQAIEFCRKVWLDRTRPSNERALALCWLGHIVADSHQPCHSGSLYSPNLFPKGDRGGNQVSTKQEKNLHLFWDSRLGSLFDVNDLNQRYQDITADEELVSEAKAAGNRDNGLDQLVWIKESAEYGRSAVYTREILVPMTIAEDSKSPKPEMVELSEEYILTANKVSRRRAAFAARRLAIIWAQGL
jgi:hypothetical protein